VREIAGARVVESREVARATWWLLLEADEDLPEPHAPGDVVAVYVADLSGRWVRHPYTVCFADATRIGLLVRVIRHGRISPALAALHPGDTLRLGGRFGEPIARLVGDAPALVGISTGTGVGPLAGWARAADRPAVLLAGFREAVDIPFAEELGALPNISWLPTLSRPGAGWTGRAGRVGAHIDAAVAALRAAGVEPRRAHWHLVGNGAMVTDVRHGLFSAGLDHGRVTTETYHNRGTAADAAVAAAVARALG
jgi:ferredoxin-NADP reductase